MKIAKKHLSLLLALFMCAAILTGCKSESSSSSTSTGTSFTLNEDGSVTHVINDSLSEGMNKDDFSAYLDEQINQYNSGSQVPKIELVSCEYSGMKVKIEMKYASVNDYASFNEVTTYYGTVENALKSGYVFDGTYKCSNDTLVSGYTIPAEYPWLHVLIIKEPMDINIPKEAVFTTDLVSKNGKSGYTVGEDLDSSLPEVFQTTNISYSYLIF